MKYTLKELLDIPRLRDLLESFDEIHSMPSAIIDLDGNVLIANSWQDICTKFHRMHPETEKKCIASDTHIGAALDKQTPHVVYRCPMGLVDSATPLIVEGQHLGNVFTGQLFMDLPDEARFIAQARQYGFDETTYLQAMRTVPYFSEEHLLRNLTFIHGLAQMLAEQGLQNKRLQESESRLSQIAEHSRTFIWEVDSQGLYTFVSPVAETVIGYRPDELVGQMHFYDLHPASEREQLKQAALAIFKQRNSIINFENSVLSKNGQRLWVNTNGIPVMDASGNLLGYRGSDTEITERKEAQQALQYSHELMRYIIEHTNSAVAVHDRDLRYVYVSQRYLDAYNVKIKDVIGRHHYDVFPDLPQKWRDVHQLALTGKISSSDCDPYYRADGTVEWTRWECRPWYDTEGAIAGIIVYTEVITDSVLAVEELKESEARIRAITESAKDAIIMMDPKGNISYWNPAAEQIFGYTMDEAIGLNLHGLLAPQRFHSRYAAAWPEFQRTGQGKAMSTTLEVEAYHKDGHELPIELSLSPLHIQGGWHSLGIVRDITERKRIENTLLFHKTILEVTGQIAKVGGWSIDALTGEETWTEEVARIHDIDPAQPTTRDIWFQYYLGESRAKIAAAVNEAVERGIAYDLNLEFQSAKGTKKWVRTIGHPVWEHGRVVRLHGSFQDITDLVKTEEELRESEERFRALVDNAPDGIFVHSAGRLLYVNPAFVGYLGADSVADLLGREIMPLIAPEYHPAVRKRLQTQIETRTAVAPMELEYVKLDGARLWVETAAMPIYYKGQHSHLVFVRDITARLTAEAEQEHLQSRLQQAQKMEAIGTLAGGIAHDFNNILGAILGYTELACDALPPESEAVRSLEKVMAAGYRASGLVKQILIFSRQAVTELVCLQPALVMKEVLKILRPSLPSTITINQHFADSSNPILADPTEVHQILMNLCTNAFHAMEQTGGILDIGLENRTLARADLIAQPDVQPGDFAVLSVGDTGAGIPQAIRDKIFEPYFTTKEVGKGTGMGLAIIHGIIKKYGGFITCESFRGQGTVFHVFFPVIATDSTPVSTPVATVEGGKERILLIDDEEILVDMGKAMLEHLGYQVTVRTNSLEALTLFHNQPDAFDVVITDQTMPGMTGMDIARRMLHIRPALPIILCTGFSNLVNEELVQAAGIKGFAMKPLNKNGIATLIRKVLAENSKDADVA